MLRKRDLAVSRIVIIGMSIAWKMAKLSFTDVDGNIYYLYPVPDGTRGRMLTGWQTIDGKMYYFNTVSDGTRGALYVNRQTPDGYLVGADGARIAQ